MGFKGSKVQILSSRPENRNPKGSTETWIPFLFSGGKICCCRLSARIRTSARQGFCSVVDAVNMLAADVWLRSAKRSGGTMKILLIVVAIIAVAVFVFFMLSLIHI